MKICEAADVFLALYRPQTCTELNNEGNGALERIRTPDPQIRSLVLYPAELRAHLAVNVRTIIHKAAACPV